MYRGGGQAGFASSSPVFVPAGVLGAVDGGGMLGDIDAGFKVCVALCMCRVTCDVTCCLRVWTSTVSTTEAGGFSEEMLPGAAGSAMPTPVACQQAAAQASGFQDWMVTAWG